jgi:hypothetical protein
MSVQKGLVYDKLDDQKPRDSYETDETMRPYSYFTKRLHSQLTSQIEYIDKSTKNNFY